MKNFLCWISAIIMLIFYSSCAVLTDSQLKMVEDLSWKADTVVSSPVAIFNSLSRIRMERGLYYAASLNSAEARFNELNSLAESHIGDRQLIKKTEIYIDVIKSYVRAVGSLSNDERWKGVGREFRGIGGRVDSLIMFYNKLNVDDEIPEGFAKLAGKTLGSLGEQIMKGKRAVFLKEFIIEGDSLISVCSDTLCSILRGGDLNSLIDNEYEGLQNNYKIYLSVMESRGLYPETGADRHYVELYEEVSGIKQIRNRCTAALRSFKNAHHKLAAALKNEEDIQLYPQLLEFNEIASDLCRQIRTL